MADTHQIEALFKNLFPGLLGISFLEAEPTRVRARLTVRDDLCTVPGVLHGGALMAFADTLGAVGTSLNLEPGDATTTIESKTNFLAAGRAGADVIGEATPLHRGRRTMVWQTRVTSEDGKLLALVTQTQAVLERSKAPAEVMAGLFQGKSPAEQQALLETLERAGGALYRNLAKGEPDATTREELLRAAEREDANALALERLRK